MSKKQIETDILIIGAGQAGLSMSYLLKENEIDHLVLEKGSVGNSWRNQRWDSFRLVTQNWQNQLRGYPYSGEDTEGFLAKNDIIRYLEGYQSNFNLPVLSQKEVQGIALHTNGTFKISVSDTVFFSKAVVVAAGSFCTAKIPESSHNISDRIFQIHSSQYRNPNQLPPGPVLVVGSGQSSVQIASEIHQSGRKVLLSVDRYTRIPRTYRGRDIMRWLTDLGITDLPASKFPLGDQMRSVPSPVISNIPLGKLAKEGIELLGRFKEVKGSHLYFGEDLKASLSEADIFLLQVLSLINQYISKNKIRAHIQIERPDLEHSYANLHNSRSQIDLDHFPISTIIWSTGFKSDYSWINLPIFDDTGFPIFQRGITEVPGFYFLGLHWLYNLKSGSLFGVGDDAQHLLEDIKRHLRLQNFKESSNSMSC